MEIAVDFRRHRVSYIIVSFKTMELTLTLTLTHTDFRGHDWYEGVCHGQNRGTCCGNCSELQRTSVVIAAYRRIAVTMAADGRRWPLKLLRLDIRGNCRGNFRGLPRTSVVIAALPWRWPRMAGEISTQFPRKLPWQLPRTSRVAMVGTTEFATDRIAARAVATTVAFAVEMPRAVALALETRGFHGNPSQHPQKSTEVLRSLPRTSAKRPNNVHPWE